MRRLTTEEFIAKATDIHGDKYDYSKVKYTKSIAKVCIVCKLCGYEFWQTPNDHLCGKGCPSCAHNIPLTKERFVSLASAIHGNKYGYERVECKGWKDKVQIYCPKHGYFWQSPSNHISNKHGCKKCAQEVNDDLKRFTHEEIIQKFVESKGRDFDYSRVEYTNLHSKVCIGCKKHGWFFVSPSQFINGVYGCPQCWLEHIGKSNRKIFKEDFLKIASSVHGDKYGYDKVEFDSVNDKVVIFCPKHGYFEQEVFSHLKGYGCFKCRCYSSGENKIRDILVKIDIPFIEQYKIPNISLFCTNKNIYIDFYIPSLKIAIEFNGKQHYRPIKWFGGDEKFEHQQWRDDSLRQYCKEYELKLIEIPYTEYNNIENILSKELKIHKKGS